MKPLEIYQFINELSILYNTVFTTQCLLNTEQTELRLQENNGIIWEFFPNVGQHWPTLADTRPPQTNLFCFCFLDAIASPSE